MTITIALRLLIDCRVDLLYLRQSEFEIHVVIFEFDIYKCCSQLLIFIVSSQQFAKDIPGISHVSHFN